MSTTTVSIRMDTQIKQEADQLFNEMGMSLTTAFNIFVRQALRDQAMPFSIQVKQPNRETIAAMLEAEHIARDEKVLGYETAHDAIAAALNE